ncbi:MAG TPA: NAD(P)/FAD-dependent oxidoreductase [Propionibacteriaceae bacterium]|nr:NAD(P)/FAD-dependent oxidoreductase [Propionibacteriaceae bacterium]
MSDAQSSPDPSAQPMVDAVVIGAGLAGLSAAATLHARGRSVLVLEARDRIGGRVYTAHTPSGEAVEMGAQWLNPGHDHMFELVERAGLELAPPVLGDSMVMLEGKVNRITPDADPDHPGMTPFEVADLGQGLLRLHRLGERVTDNQPWAEANAAWLDQPFERWVRSNLRTPGGKAAFLHVLGRAVGLISPESTLVDTLQRIAGRDLDSLAAVNAGLQQRRVQGGMAQVCEFLAAQLGDAVHLGAVVDSVVIGEQAITVHTAEGESFTGRDVVVAIPPRLVDGIDFEPPLPEWRSDLVKEVPQGNVIKAALIYEKPWWRDRGMSGQVGTDAGPLRVMSDSSNRGSSQGVLTGFFEGAEASGLGRWTVTLRERAFVETVRSVFGPEAPAPLDYIDVDWSGERFTGGCHGAHFAPSVWTTAASSLSAPEGRIHFAGAEYATRFTGYLEGALRSGKEAADRISKR